MNISRYLLRLCTFSLFATYSIRQNLQHYLRNVSSNRGNDKINVHGYLMIEDKNRNNRYYWHCEKRNLLHCGGRATTIFVEQQHRLRNVTEHNHAAEASRVTVCEQLAR